MFGRWVLHFTAFVWAALLGPAIGFVVGQRFIGADCQLSPTAGADTMAAIGSAGDAVRVAAGQLPLLTSSIPLTQGGLRMPTDPLTLLLWLILALALAGLAAALWLRNRNQPTQAPVEVTPPEPVTPVNIPDKQWGREYKIAIGSAGIKSIVREARMEEAYQ